VIADHGPAVKVPPESPQKRAGRNLRRKSPVSNLEGSFSKLWITIA